MLRTLAPYLLLAVLIVSGATIAYSLGAPAWVVHVSVLVGVFAALPGYNRWDEQQHS